MQLSPGVPSEGSRLPAVGGVADMPPRGRPRFRIHAKSLLVHLPAPAILAPRASCTPRGSISATPPTAASRLALGGWACLRRCAPFDKARVDNSDHATDR